MRKFLPVLFLAFSATVITSVAETEREELTPQKSGDIELPIVDPDYPDGHFETRLWPESVVAQIEIEHVRFLAASPETPPEDRAMFREVLKSVERQQFVGPGF